MRVRVSGFFSDPETARAAGRTLGAPEGGAMGLIITTDCLPKSGAFAAVNSPDGGSGGAAVTVLCDEAGEQYVMAELTRLGAEKINVSR